MPDIYTHVCILFLLFFLFLPLFLSTPPLHFPFFSFSMFLLLRQTFPKNFLKAIPENPLPEPILVLRCVRIGHASSVS